jgi:ethanolamine utilization protein EutN
VNLARVVGRIVATQKDSGLTGSKLLLLQPLDSNLAPRGSTLLAADAVGAGAGETVIYVRGREASHAFLPAGVPVDAGIVGIVDEVYLDPDSGRGARLP